MYVYIDELYIYIYRERERKDGFRETLRKVTDDDIYIYIYIYISHYGSLN